MTEELLGIILLGVFSLIVSIFSLLGGIFFFLISYIPIDLTLIKLSDYINPFNLGFILIFFSIVFLVMAFGFLTYKKWSRIMGIFTYIIIIILSISRIILFRTSIMIDMIIAIVCMIYLFSPEVISFFDKDTNIMIDKKSIKIEEC